MTKTIICADALPWMEKECPPCSIVMSPPDQDEIGKTIAEWRSFYRDACRLAFRALADGSPCIIYATDRKIDGEWISKVHLMHEAAKMVPGIKMLWHKIALRRAPGAIDIHRPGYTHLCAFGGPSCRPGAASPDVIERGAMVYPNGMGLIAARFAVEFAKRPGLPLVDPFCGRGTVPAVAEALGIDAIGVDIMPDQCEHARALRLKIKG